MRPPDADSASTPPDASTRVGATATVAANSAIAHVANHRGDASGVAPMRPRRECDARIVLARRGVARDVVVVSTAFRRG